MKYHQFTFVMKDEDGSVDEALNSLNDSYRTASVEANSIYQRDLKDLFLAHNNDVVYAEVQSPDFEQYR